MNISEIESTLTIWQNNCIAVDEQYYAFQKLTNIDPDCKLFNPIFLMMDAYTKTVSAIVGDENNWLSWFAHECEYGKTPLMASINGNEPLQIKTINDLAKLVAWREI